MFNQRSSNAEVKRSRQVLLTDSEWQALQNLAAGFNLYHHNQPTVAGLLRAIANHTIVLWGDN